MASVISSQPRRLWLNGLPSFDCQQIVEEQHALRSPTFKIAMTGRLDAKIFVQFRLNVLQAWGNAHIPGHGKGKALRFTGLQIRILAENDRFDLWERDGLERVKAQ